MRWEYREGYFYAGNEDGEDEIDYLNRLGKEGWEVWEKNYCDTGINFSFKRQVNE